ncbi:glycine-rich domain-containing protein [Bacterioplanes sanyensis]|uniref:glycine-rich domain-containing protein n=1 Tax=Bacterioplanes sanyensis TaxID=1249553 RepID=UPI0012FD3D93|nr:hypothetical protein [Bacterioplanes sanyensis]
MTNPIFNDPPVVKNIEADLPSRSDSQDQFTSKANRFFSSLPEWQQSLAGLAEWQKNCSDMTYHYMEDAEKAVTDAQHAVTDAQQEVSNAAQQVVLAAQQVTLAKEQTDRAENFTQQIEGVVNFQGGWSSATSASPSTVPVTYYHSNQFWSLLQDLPDVTSIEPGTDSNYWVSTGAIIQLDEFNVSGTWFKHPAARVVFVECWGGGGGGAAVASYSKMVATGGCGGQYISRLYLASELESARIIVGSGGLGRSCEFSSYLPGQSGGSSSFGQLTASGGRGGIATGLGSYLSFSDNYQYYHSVLPEFCPISTFDESGGGRSGIAIGVSNIAADANHSLAMIYKYANGQDSMRAGGGGGTAYMHSSGPIAGGYGRGYIAGDGGNAANDRAGNPMASPGKTPGGGGGGALGAVNHGNSASSGSGGDGLVRVWQW